MNDGCEPNHVIEDGAKIIETVSEQSRDIRKFRSSDFCDVPLTVNEPRLVRVSFREHFVGRHFVPLVNDSPYRLIMLTRSLKLFNGAQRVIGHVKRFGPRT